jgi:succinate dehydrogenase / fumarate reductase membrane anchor subunit
LEKHTRPPLSRATWLGSGSKGVGHWWAERVSAIALIPLTIWFLASVIALTGRDHAGVVTWLRMPSATICMVLLLVALFYHMALGLQVVIEDYVHSGARFPVLIAIRLGCFALAVTGIVATLRISLGG